jgi:hypothetical protein
VRQRIKKTLRRLPRHHQRTDATPQWLTGVDGRALNRVSEKFGHYYN